MGAYEVLTMPRNVQRWVWCIVDGKRVKVPVPFDCACGLPANYGRDGIWRCTFCWQDLQLASRDK